MDIFKILNVNITKDKDIIKRAYLSKLQNTNPEDKPEEFMQLRESYEKALEYADSRDETNNSDENDNLNKDKSEIDLWMEKVQLVYNNFKTRNDLDKWSQLLNDDVCQGLDSKIESRDAILEFLMDNYYVSGKIMRFLNEEFDFMGNLDELYENYPRPFIDNVIVYRITDDEYPLYSLFDINEELNYDEFLSMVYELNDFYMENEHDKAIELIKKIDDLNIYHPELDKKKAQIYYSMKEYDKALEFIENIDPKYEEVVETKIIKAMILTKQEKLDEAKEYLYEVLNKDPRNSIAIEGLTSIYQSEDRLLDAKALIYGLSYKGYSDYYIIDILDNINEKIISTYEENPSKNYNKSEIIEIAWAYNENNYFDNALKLLNSIEVDKSIGCGYYALMTKVHSNLDKNLKSFNYLEKWEKSIENNEEIEITDLNRRYKCLSRVYKSKSLIYINQKEMDEALKYINKSLEILPTDINNLEWKTRILYKQRKLKEVVDFSNEIIKLNPENQVIQRIKAKALYDMGDFSRSFEVCEEMLEMYKYQIFPYVHKARILIEVEEIDDAIEILDFLEKEEVESESINFIKGLIAYCKDDIGSAKEIFEGIIEKIESNEDTVMEFEEEVYLYYIKCTYKEKNPEDIIRLANKGLECDSKNMELMYYKGWYLIEVDKLDEAQKIYEELHIIDEGNSYSNTKLGDIYRLRGDFNKALEYYTKQIELEYDDEDYFDRITLNMDLYNFDSVYEDLTYLEMVMPKNPRVYDDLGIYYNVLDKPEEALKYYLKAKSIEDRNETKELRYLNFRIATMYRRLGMYQEAVKCYEEDYEISKNEDNLYETYVLYMQIAQLKKGEEYLKRYLKEMNLSKFSVEYRHKIAMMLWQSNRLSEVKKYFSLILSDDSEINMDKGGFYYYTNNLKKALSCIEKSIEIDNNLGEEPNKNNFIIAGRICSRLGYEDEAIKYAKKVLRLLPKDLESKKGLIPLMYKYAGGAYAICREYEKAEEYLKKALEAPKCLHCERCKCIDAIVELIHLEILRENMDKAREYLEEGRKIDQSDVDIIGFGEILGC
ncbi:hypothetical protein [Terrisporobacter mayombei]|uniref:Tetratricopeptide repeat protein n=1 Tax=Terrisporobacter mayombei TaxID=1541 RepID=A0ABY9Q2I1_9FIRM|nr:hypothetical protein [Terrisporobacter mayombei]MCC3868631.1 tetratricopeptide repeat protein [Terrisporobacter mayombei]WMT80787.1 hypothetical protein TEMA_11090 [Terrisporobacter mayombei]